MTDCTNTQCAEEKANLVAALEDIATWGGRTAGACDAPNWMQDKSPHPALENEWDCGDCAPCIARKALSGHPSGELERLREFAECVNRRAEAEMMRTGTLEGAHHRAIEAEIEARAAVERNA